MSEIDTTEMTTYQRYRTKALLMAGAAGATLAPYAMAGSLNDIMRLSSPDEAWQKAFGEYNG